MKPPPNMDVPNLDAMNLDDLERFAASASTLAQYATLRACVMRSRLRGDVDGALRAEATCETLYLHLPIKWRW